MRPLACALLLTACPGDGGGTGDASSTGSTISSASTVDTPTSETGATDTSATDGTATTTTPDASTTTESGTTGPREASETEVIVTADNAYGFAYGTETEIARYHGGLEAVTAGQIFNRGEGPRSAPPDRPTTTASSP